MHSNKQPQDYAFCHLKNEDITSLIGLIESPNKNAEKLISEAYTQTRKNPENNLGRLMWKVRSNRETPSKNEPHTLEYLKKLQLIKGHAEDLINIFQFNADFIVECFDGLAAREERYSYTTDDGIDTFEDKYKTHEEICDVMAQLIAGAELLTKRKPTKPRGRPSLTKYYEFIFLNADLYEKLSEKKFTIFRHKTESGYEPITEGHRFMDGVNNILNRGLTKSKFTQTNLLNACEKAVTKLTAPR